MKKIIFILFCFLPLSCASTKRGQVIESTVYGFLGCGVIGSLSAPSNENSSAHGLLWAGLCGSATAIASEFFYREDEDKINNLREQNRRFYNELKSSSENKDAYWSSSQLLERELPEEFKNKVTPGKWRVRRVIKESKDKKSLTIGKELEIIPPKIKYNN